MEHTSTPSIITKITDVRKLFSSDPKKPESRTFGRLFDDGKFAWMCKESQLRVVNTADGSLMSSCDFSLISRNVNTKISSVISYVMQETRDIVRKQIEHCLIVAYNTDNNKAFISFYHPKTCRVLHTIFLKGKITHLSLIFPRKSHVTSLTTVMKLMSGVLTVGMEEGIVCIIDLKSYNLLNEYYLPQEAERDDQGDNYNYLLLIDVENDSKEEIKSKMSLTKSNRTHLAFVLNADALIDETRIMIGSEAFEKSDVLITAMQFIPQTMILAIGFNLGSFQLWDMNQLTCLFTSSFPDNYTPVTGFGFQEPCNDPQQCSYLWVIYESNRPDYICVPFAIMHSLLFKTKTDSADNTGSRYKNFVNCKRRFHMQLDLGYDYDGTCISNHVVSNTTSSMLGGVCDDNEMGKSRINLFIIIFETWDQFKVNNCISVAVFDMNQWYREQMPFSYFFGLSQSFISVIPVDRLSGKSYVLHDAHINKNTIEQFLTFNSPEEYRTPSSLSFDVQYLADDKIIHLRLPGIQKYILDKIDKEGPLALIRPENYYQLCRNAGLSPNFSVNYRHNTHITPLQMRNFILTILLEQKKTKFLTQCIHMWADGCLAASFCTLDALINWCWDCINHIKKLCDNICVPLFDYTGTDLDRENYHKLKHCCQLIQIIDDMLNIINAKYKHYLLDGGINLKSRITVLSLIKHYFDLIVWCMDCGLLPEKLDSTCETITPAYITNIVQACQQRRAELKNSFLDIHIAEHHSLYLIDALIELDREHRQLYEQWERESCGIGNPSYPPTTLQTLLRMYLISTLSLDTKHSIMLYFLLDVCDYHKDEEMAKKLLTFPSVVGFSSVKANVVKMLWLIDHGKFEEATAILQNKRVQKSDIHPEFHWKVMHIMLNENQPTLALKYFQLVQPISSNFLDTVFQIIVYLHNGLIVEALNIQRNSSCQQKDLLKIFFRQCDKLGVLKKVLKLALTPSEEEAFVSFLNECSDKQTADDLKVLYFLSRGRYVEAFDINRRVNSVHTQSSRLNQAVIKINAVDHKVTKITTRDLFVKAFSRSLPSVTNELLQHCEKNSTDIQNAKVSDGKCVPLSTIVHTNLVHQVPLFKNTAENLISSAISKTRELRTFSFKQQTTGEKTCSSKLGVIPFLRSDIVSNLSKESVAEPKELHFSPLRSNERGVTVVKRKIETTDAPIAKRLKTSTIDEQKVEIKTPVQDRSSIKHTLAENEVLHTPYIPKRVTPSVSVSTEIGTPKSSILKRNKSSLPRARLSQKVEFNLPETTPRSRSRHYRPPTPKLLKSFHGQDEEITSRIVQSPASTVIIEPVVQKISYSNLGEKETDKLKLSSISTERPKDIKYYFEEQEEYDSKNNMVCEPMDQDIVEELEEPKVKNDLKEANVVDDVIESQYNLHKDGKEENDLRKSSCLIATSTESRYNLNVEEKETNVLPIAKNDQHNGLNSATFSFSTSGLDKFLYTTAETKKSIVDVGLPISPQKLSENVDDTNETLPFNTEVVPNEAEKTVDDDESYRTEIDVKDDVSDHQRLEVNGSNLVEDQQLLDSSSIEIIDDDDQCEQNNSEEEIDEEYNEEYEADYNGDKYEEDTDVKSEDNEKYYDKGKEDYEEENERDDDSVLDEQTSSLSSSSVQQCYANNWESDNAQFNINEEEEEIEEEEIKDEIPTYEDGVLADEDDNVSIESEHGSDSSSEILVDDKSEKEDDDYELNNEQENEDDSNEYIMIELEDEENNEESTECKKQPEHQKGKQYRYIESSESENETPPDENEQVADENYEQRYSADERSDENEKLDDSLNSEESIKIEDEDSPRESIKIEDEDSPRESIKIEDEDSPRESIKIEDEDSPRQCGNTETSISVSLLLQSEFDDERIREEFRSENNVNPLYESYGKYGELETHSSPIDNEEVIELETDIKQVQSEEQQPQSMKAPPTLANETIIPSISEHENLQSNYEKNKINETEQYDNSLSTEAVELKRDDDLISDEPVDIHKSLDIEAAVVSTKIIPMVTDDTIDVNENDAVREHISNRKSDEVEPQQQFKDHIVPKKGEVHVGEINDNGIVSAANNNSAGLSKNRLFEYIPYGDYESALKHSNYKFTVPECEKGLCYEKKEAKLESVNFEFPVPVYEKKDDFDRPFSGVAEERATVIVGKTASGDVSFDSFISISTSYDDNGGDRERGEIGDRSKLPKKIFSAEYDIEELCVDDEEEEEANFPRTDSENVEIIPSTLSITENRIEDGKLSLWNLSGVEESDSAQRCNDDIGVRNKNSEIADAIGSGSNATMKNGGDDDDEGRRGNNANDECIGRIEADAMETKKPSSDDGDDTKVPVFLTRTQIKIIKDYCESLSKQHVDAMDDFEPHSTESKICDDDDEEKTENALSCRKFSLETVQIANVAEKNVGKEEISPSKSKCTLGDGNNDDELPDKDEIVTKALSVKQVKVLEGKSASIILSTGKNAKESNIVTIIDDESGQTDSRVSSSDKSETNNKPLSFIIRDEKQPAISETSEPESNLKSTISPSGKFTEAAVEMKLATTFNDKVTADDNALSSIVSETTRKQTVTSTRESVTSNRAKRAGFSSGKKFTGIVEQPDENPESAPFDSNKSNVDDKLSSNGNADLSYRSLIRQYNTALKSDDAADASPSTEESCDNSVLYSKTPYRKTTSWSLAPFAGDAVISEEKKVATVSNDSLTDAFENYDVTPLKRERSWSMPSRATLPRSCKLISPYGSASERKHQLTPTAVKSISEEQLYATKKCKLRLNFDTESEEPKNDTQQTVAGHADLVDDSSLPKKRPRKSGSKSGSMSSLNDITEQRSDQEFRTIGSTADDLPARRSNSLSNISMEADFDENRSNFPFFYTKNASNSSKKTRSLCDWPLRKQRERRSNVLPPPSSHYFLRSRLNVGKSLQQIPEEAEISGNNSSSVVSVERKFVSDKFATDTEPDSKRRKRSSSFSESTVSSDTHQQRRLGIKKFRSVDAVFEANENDDMDAALVTNDLSAYEHENSGSSYESRLVEITEVVSEKSFEKSSVPNVNESKSDKATVTDAVEYAARKQTELMSSPKQRRSTPSSIGSRRSLRSTVSSSSRPARLTRLSQQKNANANAFKALEVLNSDVDTNSSGEETVRSARSTPSAVRTRSQAKTAAPASDVGQSKPVQDSSASESTNSIATQTSMVEDWLKTLPVTSTPATKKVIKNTEDQSALSDLQTMNSRRLTRRQSAVINNKSNKK